MMPITLGPLIGMGWCVLPPAVYAQEPAPDPQVQAQIAAAKHAILHAAEPIEKSRAARSLVHANAGDLENLVQQMVVHLVGCIENEYDGYGMLALLEALDIDDVRRTAERALGKQRKQDPS